MPAHGIHTHAWIARVNQLQHSLTLLLDEIGGLLLEFVIGQSFALDFNALVSASEIAIETLLVADTAHVNRDDDKDSAIVEVSFAFGGTVEDGAVQRSAAPEFFVPKEGREIGCRCRTQTIKRSGPRVGKLGNFFASDFVVF